MLFVQTTAPTGWTKSTTHNNKALRVVSGTAAPGGSVAFTTAFANQPVSGTIDNTTATNQATTLILSQIPGHNHAPGYSVSSPPGTSRWGNRPGNPAFPIADASGVTPQGTVAANTSTEGGGGSHNHTQNAHNHTFTGTAINLAVEYVDVIIATKD
jgi:hypothetical protein